MAIAQTNIEEHRLPAAMATTGVSCGLWFLGVNRCALIVLGLAACLCLGMRTTLCQSDKEARTRLRTSKDSVIVATPVRPFWNKALRSSCFMNLPPCLQLQAESSSSGLPSQRQQKPKKLEAGPLPLRHPCGGRGGSNLWGLSQRDHGWITYTHSRNEKFS
jgi:hypothetical protein